MSCNPDRVVLKRIVLSGHPLKINRRTATIRYMFFNREDIEYFRPVKLRTRCGLMGHIKETLGMISDTLPLSLSLNIILNQHSISKQEPMDTWNVCSMVSYVQWTQSSCIYISEFSPNGTTRSVWSRVPLPKASWAVQQAVCAAFLRCRRLLLWRFKEMFLSR